MRLIGKNSLKTSLLILMSIAHSYSLLWISYFLMSPCWGGTYRVVIGSILAFQCIWQCTGSRRMGRRSIILHAGGRGLWCVSVFWSLKIMRKSSKMTKTISLIVQKCWSSLWCHGITRTGSFAQTCTSHQCLLLNNCGNIDSAPLALSRQQQVNLQWRTFLT